MLQRPTLACLMLAVVAANCSPASAQGLSGDTTGPACVTTPSPRATFVEWNFTGDPLPLTEQTQLPSALRIREYGGTADQISGDLAEFARRALENLGYFTPRVEPEVRILTSNPARARVAVTLQLAPGPQYRLGKISFANNRAITNLKALRSLFPIKNGDIFSREQIEKGLDEIRRLYGNLGFANFTSVPSTEVHPESQSINLRIDIDEGKQFYISSLEVTGLDPARAEIVLRDAAQGRGEVYNQHLRLITLKRHAEWLPSGIPPDLLIHRTLDEREGTVAVTLDFQPQMKPCEVSPVASLRP